MPVIEKGFQMSFTDLSAFNQVVALVQAGHKQEAYVRVKALAKSDPGNTNLLLWLAYTTPDLHQAELAINKVALLDPAHPSIPVARQWLAQERHQREGELLPVRTTMPQVEQSAPVRLVSAPVADTMTVTMPAPREPLAVGRRAMLQTAPLPPMPTSAREKVAQTAMLRIKGNIKTKVYHMPDGAFYWQLHGANVRFFSSEAEAQSAGFRRSKT
jgi:hypothetical protein